MNIGFKRNLLVRCFLTIYFLHIKINGKKVFKFVWKFYFLPIFVLYIKFPVFAVFIYIHFIYVTFLLQNLNTFPKNLSSIYIVIYFGSIFAIMLLDSDYSINFYKICKVLEFLEFLFYKITEFS